MAIPELSPTQARRLSLGMMLVFGVLTLYFVAIAVWGLLTGEITSRNRSSEVLVSRRADPAAFHIAVMRSLEPCAFLGPMAWISLAFYRRLRD